MLGLEVLLCTCVILAVCAGMTEAGEREGGRVVVRLGETEGPADLDRLLGVCMFGPDPDTASPWHEAWRRIGLKHVRGPGLGVERKSAQETGLASEAELDFSALDGTMAIFRQMGTENLLSIHGTPKYLSSNPEAGAPDQDHYSQYAPGDYARWEQHIAAVVRHMVEKWDCKGAHYEFWNEPEDFKYYWKGRPGSGDTLADYVALYAHTAKAVARVDPTAKLGAPATAHWDSAAGGAHAWGLPQFLRAFAEYREAHPAENVPLDFIAWHDYTWISHAPSLLTGVAFVDKVLDELGWKERPEYWITEWNLAFGEWAEKHSPFEFSAHIAHNIVEQANPRTGRLSRLYFYVFDRDGNPKTPLISGWGDSATESGEVRLQPSAAVFQMANELNQGDLVRCEATSPLVAAATQAEGSVRVMAANYTAQPCTAELVIEGVEKAKEELQCTLRRVDERHSCDGNGLESGESGRLTAAGGAARLPIDMPAYSSVLVVVRAAE